MGKRETIDGNLFDYFDVAAGGGGGFSHWALRAPYRPHERYDLMLVPRSREWMEDREAVAELGRIEAEPWVAALEREGDQPWLRLADEWVERRGEALERREGLAADYADLAGGRRFALNFWDANSTKALHIGHLRNLSLGNALAAALTQAGGQVERRSIICDVGRSMGEAMAGVIRSGRYPQGSGEVDVQNDSADELLLRVLNGDQTALELWSQTRAWVISGQRKTLARLGISFDRVFFESDFLPEVAELSNLGLEHGMLQRRPDGAIIYLTDREELEEMPLLRADGLPTKHMRALAYWMAAPGLEGTTSIQVCGLEWVAHVTCRRQLMDEMMEKGAGAEINHPAHDVFHGMVSKQNESVSSSKKNALLIDELAEWIETAIDAEEERVGVRDRHPAAEAIVPQVALGYFL